MNIFTPQNSSVKDTIATALHMISRWSFVLGLALLPVLFIPVQNIPVLDGKLFITLVLVSVALLAAFLYVLRVGTISYPASATLSSAWLVAGAALVSALLSGDVTDSLQMFSGVQYTATTIIFGVLVLSVATIIGQTTKAAVWFIGVTALSLSALLLWHTARLLTGADVSFGAFPVQTTSILGSWNDVAIAALALVLGLLLALAQSLITGWWRVAAGLSLLAGLFVLLVINNTVLWTILGIISLTIVVLAITRRQSPVTPRLLQEQGSSTGGWLLVFASLIFVATAGVFIGGDTLQQSLTTATNSEFVEVRPSVSASFDIIRSTWETRVLTGVGPAKYTDAWRLYKDASINSTVFWNTNFTTGHNFVLTQAVEVGLLGLATWILFFAALLVSGARTFLTLSIEHKDTTYRLALVAFVIALFLWFTFWVSNPGVPIFMLAMALSGLYIALSFSVRPRQLFGVSLLHNQKLSFVVVASLVVVVIALVWYLQLVTEQLVSRTYQNRAFNQNTSQTAAEVTEGLLTAAAYHQTDEIARSIALVQLNELQRLLQLANPTTVDQQAFQSATVQAVNASDVAVTEDASEPENWYVQAQVYTILTQAEVEGAAIRAEQALDQAAQLDPMSPRVSLARAELAVVSGDAEAARASLIESIQQKSDYSPALYLLAQLEITAGNVAEAITVTESILSFEPNNPARWYQLGVLYESAQQPEQAVAALTQAITLDPNYANALYIRALILAAAGNIEQAVLDLERVAELNPDSNLVAEQLQALRSGDTTAAITAVPTETTELTDPETISSAAAETDLITTTTNSPDTETDDTATVTPTDPE